MPWQFWIDVGGTFTDCLACSPDGALTTHKVLSSGATLGTVAEFLSPIRFVDPARCGEPSGFWNNYAIRLFDRSGQPRYASRVIAFDPRTGAFECAAVFPVDLPDDVRYELKSHEEAPLLAIRRVLGLGLADPVPPVEVRLGTTRGTNALLTRRGARTALVTTRGFADVLLIANQDRPRLFDLAVVKPAPLFEQVLEIDERIAADGVVLQAPDVSRVTAGFAELRAAGIESVAICLLHAFAFPQHEEIVAEAARAAGFTEVSVSHRLTPSIKIVSRGDTTVVDAYLNPVLRNYVAGLQTPWRDAADAWTAGGGALKLMTSAGGLVQADRFVGKDSILSGPAGGVIGFSRVAQAAGFAKAIGFDMGGTSTDVSRFDGTYELEFETLKAGVRVSAPMLAIETVAAGGGSLCRFDGVKLTVGPASAGAQPGPACYGQGGPLTVTDVNLFLGKLLPEHFPLPLDLPAVAARLAELCAEIAASGGPAYTAEELAEGFVQVANANMVRAIRRISVAKGYDPRDYVLVTFGGAGAQHACAMARSLGIRQVLSHPLAGVLSAYGIGLADVRRYKEAPVLQPYRAEQLAALEPVFRRLEQVAREEVRAEGIPETAIAPAVRVLDLRYRGVDAVIHVPAPDDGDYARRFRELHQQLYGYVPVNRPLEIVTARVEVVGTTPTPAEPVQPRVTRRPAPTQRTTARFEGRTHDAGVYLRADLRAGDVIDGPAILCEPTSTVVVDPGFTAEILERGEIVLTDVGGPPQPALSREADPIRLEIFNNLFASIAEQMGTTLQKTSCSTNVKERLDFSCALFDARGDLIVNAPHIPVHLGAMGETVQRILRDNAPPHRTGIHPGDVFVTNDPYRGGSHLPDVTVVTPVHDEASGELRFLTASRAHHAEIGGIVPGSMPPFSKNLGEEGVLIRNFKLVDRGTSREPELERLLASGPYPSRSVRDNLADVAAQVAANRSGARQLQELIARYTWPVVEAYMRHIQDAAETKIRRALAALPDGVYARTEHLDDGSPIQVAITIAGDRATVDFTGTGPVLAGNLNANRAIVRAAVLYVFRCLIDEDIPLNSGVLAPVEIVLPECLLNPPEQADPAQSAAVVGGNVETSQRVVDTLLGAFGVAAASQGTMNNLTFGDATFGYYETICGGNGGTPKAPGADAVHTHMTNTRLTDVEVLERRYPVRVQAFHIRRGSGGAGRFRGGDGIVRRIEFLQPLHLSILSERRGPYPPYGLAGGAPGALGRNTLQRSGSPDQQDLGGKVQTTVAPGDVLTIETPGGGGYGPRQS